MRRTRWRDGCRGSREERRVEREQGMESLYGGSKSQWNLNEVHHTRNSVCTCLDLILLETCFF